ncbi:FUSC family protein [Pedobacter sp. PWIIR3]
MRILNQIRLFFLGEYFSDALRNTLVILLPVLLFFSKDEQMAIALGVGALLISLTDLPGNRGDKFRTALSSILIFSATALIFSLTEHNKLFTGLAFTGITFAWCMLSAFGQRAGLTGTMAIILSTFIMGLQPQHPVQFSLYIFLGGCWFYAVSLLQVVLFPYRSLHHVIYECLNATASYLKTKACFYQPEIPLDSCYKNTVTGHLKVSEKQQMIRVLLLSDKKAMRAGNPRGERLLSVATAVINLYEEVTAIQYDYTQIREQLQRVGALPLITEMIELLANRTGELSQHFLNKKSTTWKNRDQFDSSKDKLKELALGVLVSEPRQAKILTDLYENFTGIAAQLDLIQNPKETIAEPDSKPLYAEFLGSGLFPMAQLKSHLSFRSPVLRFALRLSLSFLVGYLLIQYLGQEKYSYWLLLTIVIVARPRFSVTWKRNLQRIGGTFAGLVMTLMILVILPPTNIQLIIAATALTGFFAFNRTNYSISVACITIAVVMSLSIYRGDTQAIFQNRAIYTIAGCLIAFASVYLLPIWDSKQLKGLIAETLSANLEFLNAITDPSLSSVSRNHQGRLARKTAHLKLAKLSEALQHIKLEPRGKQQLPILTEVQIICYRINGLITSMFLTGELITASDGLSEIKSRLKSCETAELNVLQTHRVQSVNVPYPSELLLEGIALLESLSIQLAACFEKRPNADTIAAMNELKAGIT